MIGQKKSTNHEATQWKGDVLSSNPSNKNSIQIEKNTMKVLILCSSYSVYTIQLWKYMKKYYSTICFSLLTEKKAEANYKNNLFLQEDEAIYTYKANGIVGEIELAVIIAELPHFDIIHSLWMEPAWGLHTIRMKSRGDYWVSSVGGSDLWRESQRIHLRLLMKRIIKRADWLTCETQVTEDKFFRVFGEPFKNKKHTINPFGVDLIDSIMSSNDCEEAKIKMNIPDDKVVIMCGHNASPAHQHLEVIKAMAGIPERILKNCFFLFPMTYPDGNEDYIYKCKAKVEEVTENVLFLTEFMNTDEFADVIKATDIMLHVQTTDQLSSTMMANLFNGNVVVAGSWLPYDSLRSAGLEFLSINRIADLASVLPGIISRIEEIKASMMRNQNIVYGISSWECSAKRWYNVYSTLTSRRERKNGYTF